MKGSSIEEKDLDFKESFNKDFVLKCIQKYGRDPKKLEPISQYDISQTMIRNIANINGKECKDNDVKKSSNQLITFSMEFLSVKYLTLNLNNLGILKKKKKGLKEIRINYEALVEPGLGNGLLGRFAACYLDSASSLWIQVDGNWIREVWVWIKQKIRSGRQEEYPDTWFVNSCSFI